MKTKPKRETTDTRRFSKDIFLLLLTCFSGVLISLGLFYFTINQESKWDRVDFYHQSDTLHQLNTLLLDHYLLKLKWLAERKKNSAVRSKKEESLNFSIETETTKARIFKCSGEFRGPQGQKIIQDMDPKMKPFECETLDSTLWPAVLHSRDTEISGHSKTAILNQISFSGTPYLVFLYQHPENAAVGYYGAVSINDALAKSQRFNLKSEIISITSKSSLQQSTRITTPEPEENLLMSKFKDENRVDLVASIEDYFIGIRYQKISNNNSIQVALIVLLIGLMVTTFFSMTLYSLVTRNLSVQSEVQRQSKEIIAARSRAEKANQAKSEFIASISHELRTPLNLVLGISDLLVESPLNSIQTSYVKRLRNAGEQLLDLINDLLDIPKIEKGTISIRMKDVNFIQLVEDISEGFSVEAQKKGLRYGHFLDLSLPDRLEIDPKRFKQILSNLLSNAIRYTKTGSVQLRVSREDSDGKSWLRILVADSGIGISREHQDRIFERYYGSNLELDAFGRGVGIGLSLVKTYVKKLGGEVRLKSEKGKGSCFAVRLPIHPKSEYSSAARLSSEWAGYKIQQVSGVVAAPLAESYAREIGKTIGLKLDLVQVNGNGEDLVRAISGISMSAQRVLLDVSCSSISASDLLYALGKRPDHQKIILLLRSGQYINDQNYLKKNGVSIFLISPIRSSTFANALLNGPSQTERQIESNTKEAHPQPKELRPQNAFQPIRALIVEDDYEARLLFDAYLKNSSIVADFAFDGQDGLNKLAANPNLYQIIVTDLRMPNKSGLDLIKEFRGWPIRSEESKPIPIIVLTADTRQEQTDLSIKLGADAHLTKPISKKRLIAAIVNLAQKEAEPENSVHLPAVFDQKQDADGNHNQIDPGVEDAKRIGLNL